MGSLRKILFVDRDGTLIREPADEQIDSLEKLELVEGVVPALLRLRDAAFRFVIVTNQDGLGSSTYPREAYDRVQSKMLQLFSSQGIEFDETLVCPHRVAESCLCRKPHLGLVRPYLTGDLDLARSAVAGDRETDVQLAKNMGVRGWRVGASGTGLPSWKDLADHLLGTVRSGECVRATRETRISARVILSSGSGAARVATGIGYFDHMLEQLARHGGFDLELRCEGDLGVDEHHTVEDVALSIGEALRRALGDKAGVGRYGFTLPMDEALASAALDLSGRPVFVFQGRFPREKVGELPTELVLHFFRSLCEAMGATLHLSVTGENAHHMVESCFKAVARALRMAAAETGGAGVPSTKGAL